MSDADHAAAFKTRIAATATPPLSVLDLKQAQDAATAGTLPAKYVLVFVSRRSLDNNVRMGGTFEPTGFRLTTRVMALNSISDAYNLERLVRSALLLNPITLDGESVDVRYETGGGDFDKDDEGYMFANTDWIYVR